MTYSLLSKPMMRSALGKNDDQFTLIRVVYLCEKKEKRLKLKNLLYLSRQAKACIPTQSLEI